MSNTKQFTKYLFPSPSVANGKEPEIFKEHFAFKNKLSIGAFGQVWKCKHRSTGKIYAIKQVPKDKVIKMLPQFKREILIMYELEHPHIVKLYNHFEDDRNFYLIMEYIPNGTILERLQKYSHFLEREAAQYFRETVLAIEYLHSHVPPIIHRDIKPENILIDEHGRVKLTDFGWSNYYLQEDSRQTLCGTLEYLSPEMVKRASHNTKLDIWCLGILLYEMMAGATPFKSANRDVLLTRISNQTVKYPRNFPHLAIDLIDKMLCKNPQARFDIWQVKEHQWLQENQQLRETISQVLEPILSPEQDTKIEKGYKIISKNSYVTSGQVEINQSLESDFQYSDSDMEDTKSDSRMNDLLDESFLSRDSVSHLQKTIQGQQEVRNYCQSKLKLIETSNEQLLQRELNIKNNLMQKQNEIQDLQDECIQLRVLVKNKEQEIANWNISDNIKSILHLKEQAQFSYDRSHQQCEQIRKRQQEQIYKQKSIDCRIQKGKLEILELKQQLDLYNQDYKYLQSSYQSSILESVLEKDKLQNSVTSRTDFNNYLITEGEQDIGEIVNYLKQQMKKLDWFNFDLWNQKIKKIQKQSLQKDKQIQNLRLQYEKQIEDFAKDYSSRKRLQSYRLDEIFESTVQEYKMQQQSNKRKLNEQLDMFRRQESKFQTNQLKIYKARYKIMRLKDQSSDLQGIIQQKRSQRRRIKQEIAEAKERIDYYKKVIMSMKRKSCL